MWWLYLIILTIFIQGTSGQNCVGRVRTVSGSPTSSATYAPARIKTAPSNTALPAEEFSSLLQLAALLSKAQSPPPPPPPPAPTSPANNALNTGGIIDKLIDALIITATQKNHPAPSSSRLIDIDVLKSLLSLQGLGSSTSSAPVSTPPVPAASTTSVVPASESTQTSATALPASSTLPQTTSSSAPASSVLLEDASSIVGDSSANNLSSLSSAIRSLLNPEQK